MARGGPGQLGRLFSSCDATIIAESNQGPDQMGLLFSSCAAKIIVESTGYTIFIVC